MNANRAIAAILVGLVALYGGTEFLMRTTIANHSATQVREAADRQAALHVGSHSDTRRSMLIVGNSLLLEGVDRDDLVDTLAPETHASVYPIENTTYLDWYFGMRRLFAEGSLPDVVVLTINARQLIAGRTNGAHFAHYMMQISDLPAVIRESHLDSMTASAYFFAHWSRWLAARSNLRNALMLNTVPHADLLAAHLAAGGVATYDANATTVSIAVDNLKRLQDLCKANGSRFVMVFPPSANPSDPAPGIMDAAKAQGIEVLMPFYPGEMPVANFRDGLHLSHDGAILFTERLASRLQRAL